MNKVLLFFSLFLIFSQPVSAKSYTDPALMYYLKECVARMVMTTDLPSFPKEKKTVVSVTCDPKTGKVKTAAIKESCGIKTMDFGCLEACYALAPVKVKTSTAKYDMDFSFSEKSVRGNRKLPENCYIIHKIPLTVSVLYPESFGKGELQQRSNIVVIKTNNYSKALEVLKKFYSDWYQFFSTNKDVSKAVIEKQAVLLANKYQLGKQEKTK